MWDRLFQIGVLLFSVVSVSSCNQEYTPKPRGYMRIALPEKSYSLAETDCPYSFEFADYAKFVPDTRQLSGNCWFDIDYPQFKAKLHFSYLPVNGNLAKYLEDSRTLTNKHISKASNIEESLILKDDTRVFGTIYQVEGSRAASPIQFHLTDSTNHFLRGALYFNVTPNNDSLAPVIDFLRDDVLKFIETLEWNS
jgi:gliding motility-associated lipoprotein GldD